MTGIHDACPANPRRHDDALGAAESVASGAAHWLVGLLALSIALNCWLVADVVMRHRASQRSTDLTAGSVVGPLKVLRSDGAVLELNVGSEHRPTILYVFAPDCHWCQVNSPLVADLAGKAVDFRVIGIATKGRGLAEYLERNVTPFPVYVVADDTTVRSLRIRAVPTTVVVARDGRVIGVVRGAYRDDGRTAIEAATRVTLTRSLIP